MKVFMYFMLGLNAVCVAADATRLINGGDKVFGLLILLHVAASGLLYLGMKGRKYE